MSQSQNRVDIAKLARDTFDHSLAHETFTVADAAREQSALVDDVHFAARVLQACSLIEMSNTSEMHSSALTTDVETVSRKQFCERLVNLKNDIIATARELSRDRQTVAQSVSQSQQRTQRVATTEQTARTRYVLRALSAEQKNQRVIVTTSDSRYLSAYAEHKYEQAGDHCMICDDTHSHCKSLAICSRCYNRARLACEDLFHSRAVVTALRAALSSQNETQQNETMTRFVEQTRKRADITQSVTSASRAARLLKQQIMSS